MDSDTQSYIAAFALTILSLVLYSFFVMLGVAILRTSRSQLREMDLQKTFGARMARRIVKASDKYLLIVQSGNLLSGLALGISVYRVAEMGRLYFWNTVLGEVPGYSYEQLTFIFILVFASALALIVAQVGKAISYSRPEEILCMFSYPLRAIGFILTPVTFLLEDLIGTVIRFVGYRVPKEREIVLSPEDLTELVEHSTRAGGIEEEEGELIQGVVSFGEKTVTEIMTPRKDVRSVRFDDSLQTIVLEFQEAGFSRLLVIGDELDDVRGVVLAKDLLPLVGKSPAIFDIESILREPLFVEGTREIDKLLSTLRGKAAHLAVVLDEHGGVDGLVTLEDLIEEIVGDIFDEHDSPEEEREIQQTNADEWLVDGAADLNDLRYEHGLSFPDGEYDTIAGFVIDKLGKIPSVGDVVIWDIVTLEVQEVDQNRVTLLKIVRNPI